MIPCLFSPINFPKLPPPPSILQRSLILDRDSNLFPSSSSFMESFALPNLWKPPTAGSLSAAAADRCLVSVVEEEEEESFFELEFTLPDYDDRTGCGEDQQIGRIGDFLSGEKPDPRMLRSKPQSTMSILRQSAPKFRVFMFGRPIKRSKPEKSSLEAPQRKARINLTVKLRIDEAAPSKKKFGRSDSSKGSSNGNDGCSRRFSKDSVHKYLNLIKKPLYVKLSSTNPSTKQRESFDSAATASFAVPRKSEERTTVKKLGKSKSAGALLVGASSPNDDSLVQQNDGIQGAILHCKQSFNSSTKERRVMSRCASDTSNEKSYQRTE